jgi:hypothetical protein
VEKVVPTYLGDDIHRFAEVRARSLRPQWQLCGFGEELLDDSHTDVVAPAATMRKTA